MVIARSTCGRGKTARWQVNLPTAVAITANTTDVVPYHTNVGGYAADGTYFATAGVNNPPLQAPANGADGGNGVYQYGPGGTGPGPLPPGDAGFSPAHMGG
jgi:hypothetical protein